MAKAHKNSMQTVRPGISWKAHKRFYAAVAVMTALLIYLWGWNKAQQADLASEYTATAAVCHPSGSADATVGGGVAASAGLDFSALQLHIRDAENLQHAILAADASLAALPPPQREATLRQAIDELRQTLQVSTSAVATPREVRVEMQCSGRDPAFVVALVNTLANQYAQDCRAQWKQRTQEAYQAACDASQAAHRQLTDAKNRLTKLVVQAGTATGAPYTDNLNADKLPLEAQQATGKAELPADSSLAAQKTSPSEPATADNPDWVELNRQLGELEQHRTELLVTRTPLHPAVVETETRIGERKRQLAQTPRTIPAGSTHTATAAERPANLPPRNAVPAVPAEQRGAENAQQSAELAAALHQLRGEVNRAEDAQFATDQVERQALEACHQTLRLEIQSAAPADRHAPGPGLRVLLTAMTAALTTLGGVVMVAAGVGMEPKLATLEEVELLLPVPVIGTIFGSGNESHRQPKRQWLTRLALIAAGVTLVAGCLSAAWMVI
jgi:hypothetical protein